MSSNLCIKTATSSYILKNNVSVNSSIEVGTRKITLLEMLRNWGICREKNRHDGEGCWNCLPPTFKVQFRTLRVVGRHCPRLRIWLAPACTSSRVSRTPSCLTVSSVTHWPSFSFLVCTRTFLAPGPWHMPIPALCCAPLPRLYLGSLLSSVACLNISSSDNLLPLNF